MKPIYFLLISLSFLSGCIYEVNKTDDSQSLPKNEINIEFIPSFIEADCLPVGSSCYVQIQLKNNGDKPISFMVESKPFNEKLKEPIAYLGNQASVEAGQLSVPSEVQIMLNAKEICDELKINGRIEVPIKIPFEIDNFYTKMPVEGASYYLQGKLNVIAPAGNFSCI